VSRSVLSDRKGTARPAPGGHRDGLRDNKEATPACAAGVVRAALEQANSALATATAFGRIAAAGGATPTRPVDGVDLLGEPPPMGRSLLLESPKDGRVIDVRQNVSQGVLPVDEAQPVARFAAVELHDVVRRRASQATAGELAWRRILQARPRAELEVRPTPLKLLNALSSGCRRCRGRSAARPGWRTRQSRTDAQWRAGICTGQRSTGGIATGERHDRRSSSTIA